MTEGYLLGRVHKANLKIESDRLVMAGPTGLEPATSGVTGQRSNQLNYGPMI